MPLPMPQRLRRSYYIEVEFKEDDSPSKDECLSWLRQLGAQHIELEQKSRMITKARFVCAHPQLGHTPEDMVLRIRKQWPAYNGVTITQIGTMWAVRFLAPQP